MTSDIVVYGATGTTGALVARELQRRGVRAVLAGRDGARLTTLAHALGDAPMRVAALDDPPALAAAIAGARVVIGCAGPFGRIGEPLLEAALAAGADYLDVASEPAFVRAMYERHESAARHARVAVVSGMGVGPALGDLAAAWAARALCDLPDEGAAVRTSAAGRIADDEPIEDIAIAHVLDHATATPGATRSALETLGAPAVIWQHDRWDEVSPGASHWRVDAGAELGGAREAMSFPCAEVVTVPRHVATERVATYVSWARAPWAMRVAGLAGRLTPWLAATSRTAARALEPAPPPSPEMRARTRFAVIARCRSGFDEARVTVSGRDVYATTAAIAAWAALGLAGRERGPIGVLAPSEVFAPAAALAALADAAGLVIDTSFAR